MQPRRRLLLQSCLGAAVAPAFVRHALAQDVPRFEWGVASGHPRPDGMVLWTRLGGPALPERVPVRWEVAEDEAFTRVVAQGVEDATADDAHSVHAEVSGLRAHRPHWYRFQALGQRSSTGRTGTAPLPDAPATLRFLIASCQRYDVGHYAAWHHAAAEGADLIVFLGDYIYENASPAQALRAHAGGKVQTLADYRARYAQYKSDAALQAAHAAAPWLMVWDDHEVENDYAGLTGQTLDPHFPDLRATAYKAWWEHMPVPKAWRPRGSEARIYHRSHWGRLAAIHALDDRQYRDLQACPRPGRAGSNTVLLKDCPALADARRSLLGPEQERWLSEGWDLQRHWNLLAQQTLMARFSWEDPAGGAGRYWTDGWDGYAPARQRLLRGVAQRRLDNLVVLGGDVHAHYVADLKANFDDPGAPVVAAEFCGSSITSLSLPQERIDAGLRHNPHIHYGRGDQRGYVRFDVSATQMQARLMALEDAHDAGSGIRTAARFVVERGRAGVQPG